MATVTISCSDGSGPFAEGARISLSAALDTGSAMRWEWSLDANPLADTSSTIDLKVATDTKGRYVATATLADGQHIESAPFEVKMAVATKGTGSGKGDGGDAEALPWFATTFAVWTAIIGAIVAFLVLRSLGLFSPYLDLSDAEWRTLDVRAKVATRIVVPIVVLGSLAVLVGMWMALVEWRGRFERSRSGSSDAGRPRGPVEHAAPIIDALGKLRGAALVMIVGALLMFAAAWITQSTATPPTTPGSTPTTAQP